MKSLVTHIFEAASKPSDIKKYKDTSKTKKILYKSGDKYDTSDDGYYDEFKYYSGEGNGYIKDKEGHVYDVITRKEQGDAGAIAGGSTYYYVTIKKADGEHDFEIEGWTAIMSTPVNAHIISDIKDGYYLEDYIAKYYRDSIHSKYFKDIAAKGDKNATSYEGNKAKKKEEKIIDFQNRYIKIPSEIYFEITKNEFRLGNLDMDNAESKKLNNDIEKTRDQEFIKATKEKVKEIRQELKTIVTDILMPILKKKLSEVFKTSDIDTFSGISGAFICKHEKYYNNQHYAVDLDKKTIVSVDFANNKLISDSYNIILGDNIAFFKPQCGDKVMELLKKVNEAWHKLNDRTRSKYIEDNYERIQQGYWGHMSVKDAKERAKQEFLNMIDGHDLNSRNRFVYSLELIKNYIEGDFTDGKEVEKPLEDPTPSDDAKPRGKSTKMSKKSENEAYDKMKAWHDGTRKQNVKNLSDAKLKMNYKVCKELGYDKEMDILKDEANNRNLTLENMISLKDYMSEIIDESNEEFKDEYEYGGISLEDDLEKIDL